MATNWKNEVLKYYPGAMLMFTHSTESYLIGGCESFGGEGLTVDKAWKQTYFNIVKSAPVKSKFTKGEIVNHNDYLAHKDVFNVLRSAPYLSDSDEAFMADIDKKLIAYEKLQPVNNDNCSKGNYSISDTMFMPLENDKTTDLTASKLQRVERQLKWLWAFVIILFLAFIFTIIALIE